MTTAAHDFEAETAAIIAADEADLARYAARRRFLDLLDELSAIEKSLGHTASGDTYYITDGNIDEENACDAAAANGFEIDSLEYWVSCYGNACSAAGIRCEEYGLNINKLIGRDIY